jgi:hypothetical protein
MQQTHKKNRENSKTYLVFSSRPEGTLSLCCWRRLSGQGWLVNGSSRSRRDGFVQSGLSLTRSTMQSLEGGKWFLKRAEWDT